MIKRLLIYALSMLVSDVARIARFSKSSSHNLGVNRGNPINSAEDLVYTDDDGDRYDKVARLWKFTAKTLMGRCWIMGSS